MKLDTYPYYAGVLEGKIQSMHWEAKIPGVKVNDWRAFSEYLNEQVRDAYKKAIAYENQN